MDRRFFIALGLAMLLAAAPLPAQRAEAPFTIAETGRGYGSLAEALEAAGGGDATILIAPGTYRECAVQEAGRIAFVARTPGSVAFDGVACEGKAALVLRGRSARVEGLIFQNLAVPDGNGAGIRIEAGDLLVRETLFRDSESGILSAADPDSTIRVEQSTFSGLGRCDRDLDCAHGIYIGDYGALSVVRSRFERGRGGHYVKSRAPRIEVTDSSFDDSQGQTTNYMIDLPNGATGTIARNAFVQGANKENYSALIVVAAEEAEHSSAGLAIDGNEAGLAPEARGTSFVADLSGERLALGDNRLARGIRPYERR